MALESLSAPVRSTPSATPQALRSASSGQAEKRDGRPQETTASEDTVDATALQAESKVISDALRGSIVNLVV